MTHQSLRTALFVALCGCAIAWLILTIVQEWTGGARRYLSARRATGGAALLVAACAGGTAPQPVVTVPIADVVVPSVAVAILQRILHVRRQQATVRTGDVPALLSGQELETLRTLLRIAGNPEDWESTVVRSVPDVLPTDVQQLLDSVQGTSRMSVSPPVDIGHWTLMMRVVGEPVVENQHGVRAQFGKKRALELTCWMALNKERSTRSAARTALWDTAVADSTFTTIVSDLRRSLGRITPELPTGHWSPATFTDDLPLGAGVITDLEVMDAARSSGDLTQMVSAVSLIRDVPFAGVNYIWADLDGSTTRAVITAMNLVQAVIDAGMKTGHDDAVVQAAHSGLRVMPSDDALLQVLREMCGRPTS